jgi:hypothetical protein
VVESLSKEVRALVVRNELASWGLCELGKDGAAGSQRHVPRCHRVIENTGEMLSDQCNRAMSQ